MPGADPAAEHDVTDGGKCGDLRYRLLGTNAKRIMLGVAERMAAINGQHSDSGVHSVSWHDAKNIAAGPNITQHFAGSAILSADHPHLAARLPDGRPAGRPERDDPTSIGQRHIRYVPAGMDSEHQRD